MPRSPVRVALRLLALCAALLAARPALAHKLNVWAEVDGATLRGEAYFRGGTPAQDAKVLALGPDGQTLGETRTDAEGKFTLKARYRCDHRLVVDAGDGHGGAATIEAAELPAELPAPAGAAKPASGPEAPRPTPPKSGPSPASPAAQPAGIDATRLEAIVQEAVHQAVVPLERRLQEYEEKVRFSDVLGGIGYIVGVTGLLFYFFGARKKPTE